MIGRVLDMPQVEFKGSSELLQGMYQNIYIYIDAARCRASLLLVCYVSFALRRLIDGVCPAGELALHDVQFQLCEFDKYERARLDEGYVRRYRSDSQSSPELRPIEP